MFFRLLIVTFVMLAAYHSLYWLPFPIWPFENHPWIADLIAVVLALVAGRFAWRESRPINEIPESEVVLGLLIFSGAGLAAGTFLPLLMDPNDQQGPQFGLYIFAPAGLATGALLGTAMNSIKDGISRKPASVFVLLSWRLLLWLLAIPSAVIAAAALFYYPWHEIKYSTYIHSVSDLQKRDSTLAYFHLRPLSDGDLIKLKRFKNLYLLDFEPGWASFESKLTDVGLKNLWEMNLTNLGALSLGHCSSDITDEGMKYVADIQTLKFAGLSACPQITDMGLHNLSYSNSIDTIDLRGCTGITDTGLLYLSKMPRLKKLKLGGCTNITMHGVKQLQKALPNASIEKDDADWSFQLLPIYKQMKVLNQKRPQETPEKVDVNVSQLLMKHQPKKLFPEKFNTIQKKGIDYPTFSAWATVTPTIDGVIRDREWDDADRADTIWTTQTSRQILESYHAICLVKNDADYIYVALIIINDDYRIYPVTDGIDIVFKNEGDSSLHTNEHVDDILSVSVNGGYGDYHMDQSQASPSPIMDMLQNIEAAVSHSNPVPGGMGDYVFEFRHPWHGPDKRDDIQLAKGDTVEFRITFFDVWPSGGSIKHDFPDTGYAKITIKGRPK